MAYGASWVCPKNQWGGRGARRSPPGQTQVSARAPRSPRPTCCARRLPVPPLATLPPPQPQEVSGVCVCFFFLFLLKTKQNSGIQGDLPNQAQGGLHLVSQLSPFLKCCYIERLQQQQKKIDKAKTQEGMQNGTGSRSRRRKKNNLQHK